MNVSEQVLVHIVHPYLFSTSRAYAEGGFSENGWKKQHKNVISYPLAVMIEIIPEICGLVHVIATMFIFKCSLHSSIRRRSSSSNNSCLEVPSTARAPFLCLRLLIQYAFSMNWCKSTAHTNASSDRGQQIDPIEQCRQFDHSFYNRKRWWWTVSSDHWKISLNSSIFLDFRSGWRWWLDRLETSLQTCDEGRFEKGPLRVHSATWYHHHHMVQVDPNYSSTTNNISDDYGETRVFVCASHKAELRPINYIQYILIQLWQKPQKKQTNW